MQEKISLQAVGKRNRKMSSIILWCYGYKPLYDFRLGKASKRNDDSIAARAGEAGYPRCGTRTSTQGVLRDTHALNSTSYTAHAHDGGPHSCYLFCLYIRVPKEANGCTATSERGGGEGGWGGGGRTHLLLALVIRPLTTHPFRDGAPFLLLIGTLPAFGRSVRFFRVLH